jgi:hypothetical protein
MTYSTVFLVEEVELANHILFKCLYQAALKFYNTRAGDDLHQVKILMLAPTGKAAYIIKCVTIHSALAIPAR